jgi:hypothetical protein
MLPGIMVPLKVFVLNSLRVALWFDLCHKYILYLYLYLYLVGTRAVHGPRSSSQVV